MLLDIKKKICTESVGQSVCKTSTLSFQQYASGFGVRKARHLTPKTGKQKAGPHLAVLIGMLKGIANRLKVTSEKDLEGSDFVQIPDGSTENGSPSPQMTSIASGPTLHHANKQQQ